MMPSMPKASLAAVRLEPGRYRHFKGGEYEVLSVGRHTETEELVVVYHSTDDPATIWVRPLDMFADHVQRPEGTLPRFQRASTRRRIFGLPRRLADVLGRILGDGEGVGGLSL